MSKYIDKGSYCINCNEKTEYKVKPKRINMTVRGVNFSYVEQIAYCKKCGEEVYVPDINDINVCSRKEAYRKATNLRTNQRVASESNAFQEFEITTDRLRQRQRVWGGGERVTGEEVGKALRTMSKRLKEGSPPERTISKRDENALILYNELKYWGLVSYETDYSAIKAMANELPRPMLMRVVHKLERKRGIKNAYERE